METMVVGVVETTANEIETETMIVMVEAPKWRQWQRQMKETEMGMESNEQRTVIAVVTMAFVHKPVRDM